MSPPRIPSSSLPPTVPQAPSGRPSGRGDYTVQPNDTLWGIAKRFVESTTGQAASTPQIAKALAALKERNSQLCTPERRFGDLIRAGDPVFFPSTDAISGWGGAPAEAKRAATPSAADQAAVSAQHSANADAHKQETQLGIQAMNQVATAVDAQLADGKQLSANDVAAVSQMLGRFTGNAEVLGSPAAQHLQQIIGGAATNPAVQQQPPVATASTQEGERGSLAARLASAAAAVRAAGTKRLSPKDAAEINQLLLSCADDAQLPQNPDFKFLIRALDQKEKSPDAATPIENRTPQQLGTALAHAADVARALGDKPFDAKTAAEINQLLLDCASFEQFAQSKDFTDLSKKVETSAKANDAQAKAAPQEPAPAPASAQGQETPAQATGKVLDGMLKKNLDGMLEKSKEALDESRRG